MVEYNEIIKISDEKILELKNQTLEVFEIKKPLDLDYALHLAKVISKLSPLVGNTIEFFVAKKLNENNWGTLGKWVRQDPDFPDLLFESNLNPMPGYEIKTWFPLSTEMTARFKDSQLAFEHNPIKVCLIVWIPEYIVYGKPIVLDVWIGSGKSLALARDKHYHNPPDYLIFEPEDTSNRTKNLQQRNTNGYKFQGTKNEFIKAELEVASWKTEDKIYSPSAEYQYKLRDLFNKYKYRLDTNYSKIDRIQHEDLEEFKKKILSMKYKGHKLSEWSDLVIKDEDTLKNLINDLI